MDIEDCVPELQELGPLQGFGEEVGEHLVGGAVLDPGLALSGDISDEEVPNVDVSSLLAARAPTVDLELDGALVVLVDGGGADVAPLSLDEVLRPDALRQNVAHRGAPIKTDITGPGDTGFQQFSFIHVRKIQEEAMRCRKKSRRAEL